MAGLGDLYNREPMSVDAPSTEGSVPVLPSPSTGELVPAPNTQGLYAVYGRPNPSRAREQKYSSMIGMDMGGRLGQLPGLAAAIMSVKEGRKADAIDAQKEAEVKKYMARKEAYDAIKTNQEQRASNAKYLADTIFPAAQQAYIQTWNQSKDANAASAKGTEIINKMASDAGIPIPEVAGVNFWKGATSFAVRNEKGDITTAVFKDGALAVQNKDGKFEPPNERWMSVKDVSEMMRAQRETPGANPEGMLYYYDANKNLVMKTKDQKAARAAGAVYAGNPIRVMDENGNYVTEIDFTPLSKAHLPRQAGQLEKPGAPAAMPTPPPAAQQAAQQFGRPAPVPGSPGSGQQPAAPAAAPAPAAAGQLLRRASGGRIALFDPNTKQFVRWE